MMDDDEIQISGEVLHFAPFVVPDVSAEGPVSCTCGAMKVTCSGGPDGSNSVATCPYCGCVIESRGPSETTAEDEA